MAVSAQASGTQIATMMQGLLEYFQKGS
jgi:hypothetical protein